MIRQFLFCKLLGLHRWQKIPYLDFPLGYYNLVCARCNLTPLDLEKNEMKGTMKVMIWFLALLYSLLSLYLNTGEQ